MALYFCLKDDCTGLVTEQNPIQTKHTNSGEPSTVTTFIFNDGKRTGVPNDNNPPALIYTNIQIKIEGVGYSLEQALTPSQSDVTLNLDNTNGWNIGTVIKSGLERMRVEAVLSARSVRVQRNYTSDGGSSTIQSHQIGSLLISETSSVSLALPNPNNHSTEGTFLNGGVSISTGLDPTLLLSSIDAEESTTTVRSNYASVYSPNSLIKIDNEIMKVISISGNDIVVVRGYNNTRRENHNINTTIYCVGLSDIRKTHKVFIKNDPPAGLPTQKKSDVKVVIVADEEPQ